MNKEYDMDLLKRLKKHLERGTILLVETIREKFNIIKLKGFHGKHFLPIPEEWVVKNCFNSFPEGGQGNSWIRMFVTDDQIIIERLTDTEMLGIAKTFEHTGEPLPEPEKIDTYSIPCPDCNYDTRVVRIGIIKTRAEKKIRYRCEGCGKTFYYEKEMNELH